MIYYVIGDATKPTGSGNKIIAHICNDEGKWGKGFVLAVRKICPAAEALYRSDSKGGLIKLGDIELVLSSVNPDKTLDKKSKKKIIQEKTYIVNMIAQHGIGNDKNGNPPIRYDALRECLKKLKIEAKKYKATVHMPRIGCGLAGGKWSEIEPLIDKELKCIDVYIYDLEKGE